MSVGCGSAVLIDVAPRRRMSAPPRRGLPRSPVSPTCWPAPRQSDPKLVAVVVSWLSGELPQRQIGVGWAALRSLPAPAAEPSLTVTAVDAAFSEIREVAGKGRRRGAPNWSPDCSVRPPARADFPATPARRGTAPRRPDRRDGRRGGEGGGLSTATCGALRCSAGDLPAVAAALPPAGRAGAVHPAGRAARRPDACADRHGRRGRPRTPRWHRDFRCQARRRPGTDPSRR